MTAGFIDTNNSGKLEVDFFFDPRCPYAYQSSLWIREVASAYGDDIDLRWRFFSLEQINRKEDTWNLWEQAPGEAKSLWFFLVGATINKLAGNAALGKFYESVGLQIHVEGKDSNSREVLEKAASAAGVAADSLTDVFEGKDTSGLEFIKAEHNYAVETYGAFGVPTIVFEEKFPAYVKMMPKPASDKALEVFQRVLLTCMVDDTVFEIKKPMTKAQWEEHFELIRSIKQVSE